MSNIVGPFGPGVNETVTRPQDAASGNANDTWFAPCVNNDPNTGTKIPALWLNKVTALLRRAIRGMGVAENELDDDMLLKAIQKAQRGVENLGDGTGLYAGINGSNGNHQLRTLKGVNITITVDANGALVLEGSPPPSGSQSLAAIAPMMIVEERRDGDVGAYTLNTGTTPTTRRLDTVVLNQIGGASLSSNRITLPAGTYRAEFVAVALGAHVHYSRLWNVTAAAELGRGVTVDSTSGANAVCNASNGIAHFTLAVESQIELQHMVPVSGDEHRSGDSNSIAPHYRVDSSVSITKEA